MYLKKSNSKNGRIYLSIAEGYYDSATKRTRTVYIQKIGYVDELIDKYPDPIAHFTLVVDEMNKKKSKEKTTMNISLDRTEQVSGNLRKNFGYAALSAVYHELEIDKFFANRQQSIGIEYNLNAIMRLLVFSRLLAPGSKKKAYDGRGQFFERCDFSLLDVYRALSRFSSFREALQMWIHERIMANYGRDTTIIYYDVTNYYFEIDEQDELRRKGVSKEHRPDPIVQMGLFIDNSGLPIAYRLFPGNHNDCTTLLPIIKMVRKQFGIGKAVVVGDKGMNTQKNAYYLANSRGGYVFSQSVRGGTKELKAYVLNDTGYEWVGDKYKKKSRQFTRDIEFKDDNKSIVKARIAEKQVVFYSRDYDLKAKADREPAIKKAREILQNPKNFNKYNTYGAAKYIRNLEFDKKTGEIIKTKSILSFNEETLAEDEKYDGYYVLASSRHFESDEWIIDTYKGLWRIEETFKVTKSDLEARPVFVSREERIQAHFLICFLSLVIIRLLKHKLDHMFSTSKIIDSLSKSCCSLLKDNIYMFDYSDEVIELIASTFKIDFTRKFRTQAEIKNIFASVKIL
jgi:transposase